MNDGRRHMTLKRFSFAVLKAKRYLSVLWDPSILNLKLVQPEGFLKKPFYQVIVTDCLKSPLPLWSLRLGVK